MELNWGRGKGMENGEWEIEGAIEPGHRTGSIYS